MFEFESPQLFDPEEDGITHLNIYSRARTELGRLLSNFAYSPFTFDPYGSFVSAEGFWYWYLTGQQHNSLRLLAGVQAKKEGQKFRDDRLDVLGLSDDDLEVMGRMLVHKVAHNPRIAELLMESTLPFCHYYAYGDRVIMLPEFDWLSANYEDIRAVLKTN